MALALCGGPPSPIQPSIDDLASSPTRRHRKAGAGGLADPGRAVVMHTERSQSFEIDARAEQGEVVSHTHASSHPGSTTAMAPEHQMRQFALNLGPSGLVARPPGRVFLPFTQALQRRLMRMKADGSTFFRRSTLGA